MQVMEDERREVETPFRWRTNRGGSNVQVSEKSVRKKRCYDRCKVEEGGLDGETECQ